MEEPAERTDDAMYRGAVRILQHRRGYRFSFDAVLLAHEVARHQPAYGVEFCAGSAVVSLCLAAMLPPYRGEAYELQPPLAALARENVARNGAAERIVVSEGDVRSIATAVQRPDIVFMNPPYFGAGEGTPSPNQERALARHQVNGSLVELLVAAKRVAAGGTVLFVYPGEREAAAVAALERAGLGHISVRRVLPRDGAAASFIILRGSEGGTTPTRILRPTLLHDEAGAISDAHRAIVDGLLPAPSLD